MLLEIQDINISLKAENVKTILDTFRRVLKVLHTFGNPRGGLNYKSVCLASNLGELFIIY